MWEYGLSSPRRLSWRGLEERNTHFHFVGRQVPLGRCIINLLLFYSLCGTGPALGNHSTCPPATTISSGSGHHSYQTNDHLLWEFSWENSSRFLEGDDWKESHESGDKEGSILLLHGEGLPENETQTGRLRREGGERERERWYQLSTWMQTCLILETPELLWIPQSQKLITHSCFFFF